MENVGNNCQVLNKNKMRVFMMIAALFVMGSVLAQNYVIEPANGENFADLFYVVESSDPDEPYQGGGYVTNIMKGTKVTIEPEHKGVMNHNYVIITTDGKKYFISADNLKFGENSHGVTDWVAEDYEEPKAGMSYGRILVWVIGIGVALVAVYALFRRSGSSADSTDDYWRTIEARRNSQKREEEEEKREEERLARVKRRQEEEEQQERWRKQAERNPLF